MYVKNLLFLTNSLLYPSISEAVQYSDMVTVKSDNQEIVVLFGCINSNSYTAP